MMYGESFYVVLHIRIAEVPISRALFHGPKDI